MRTFAAIIMRAYLISDLICFGASPPGTIFDNDFQWPLKTDRFALMEFCVFTDLIQLVHLLAFFAVHTPSQSWRCFPTLSWKIYLHKYQIQYNDSAFIVLTDDFPITQPCLDRSFLWWTLSMRALVCNRPAGIFLRVNQQLGGLGSKLTVSWDCFWYGIRRINEINRRFVFVYMD